MATIGFEPTTFRTRHEKGDDLDPSAIWPDSYKSCFLYFAPKCCKRLCLPEKMQFVDFAIKRLKWMKDL